MIQDIFLTTQNVDLTSVDLTNAPSDADTARKTRALGLYERFGKRVFDIFAVVLAAPIVLIIMLPLMILIARDGGSPFYKQMRIGRGGKTYRMWKLRSMVVDADRKLEAYLEQNSAAKKEWDRTQKLKQDPRITKVGQIIRKTSMDELPQLWNVLIGDMSLVGPRPMMLSQKELYPGQAYYAMRPGITGAWQVSARNESSFAERAIYDGQYHQALCAKEDMRILLATVEVVCKRTGH